MGEQKNILDLPQKIAELTAQSTRFIRKETFNL